MSTKCPLKPADGRLVVKRDTAGETTRGGIVIPETAKEKPRQGVVVAAGEGRLVKTGEAIVREPMPYSAGQRVLFGAFAGTEVEIGTEKLLILGQDDVLAVVVE